MASSVRLAQGRSTLEPRRHRGGERFGPLHDRDDIPMEFGVLRIDIPRRHGVDIRRAQCRFFALDTLRQEGIAVDQSRDRIEKPSLGFGED